MQECLLQLLCLWMKMFWGFLVTAEFLLEANRLLSTRADLWNSSETSPWVLLGPYSCHFSVKMHIFLQIFPFLPLRSCGVMLDRLSWMSLEILFKWYGFYSTCCFFWVCSSFLFHLPSLLGELYFLACVCTSVSVEAKYVTHFRYLGKES